MSDTKVSPWLGDESVIHVHAVMSYLIVVAFAAESLRILPPLTALLVAHCG